MCERTVTAFHEAGHAVASVMRGGSTLTGMTAHHDGAGLTNSRCKPFDVAFITYAGPWAEARFQWPRDIPLADLDRDGATFDDYVAGVLLEQPGDAAYLHDPWYRLKVDTKPPECLAAQQPEAVWAAKLERVWGAVIMTAQRVLDGRTPTDEQVSRFVRDL